MSYLSEDIKKGFDKYKYNCKDTSPLANYVMHPFWNWAVQFLPMWLAPNLMTLVGFLFTVATFVLLAYYDPDYTASSKEIPTSPPVPHFVWILCGVFNALSHHLDGMDGKQARRTGSSGPVGELFDHGLDSWALTYFTLSFYSVAGRGVFGRSPWTAFCVHWIVMACCALTHWEKYLTNVMYLPWAYDVGQVILTGTYLLCGILSPTYFQRYFVIFGNSFTTAQLLVYFIHIGFWGVTLQATLYNVVCSYADKTGKMLPLQEVLRPLVAPALLLGYSFLWAYSSPSNLLDTHPRLFLYTVGVVFANISCHLIVAQMSQTRADLFNGLGNIYGLVAISIHILSRSVASFELQVLQGMAIIATIVHIWYGSSVVNEMLDHFHLRAFVISPKPPSQQPSSDAH